MASNDTAAKADGAHQDNPPAGRNGSSTSGVSQDPTKNSFILIWVAIGSVSLVWWTAASEGILWRFVLVGAISLAAFLSGCLIGFLFSSHGKDESDSIAKVRDWVLGGLTTLSIAKASSIKSVITAFAAGPGPNEYSIALGSAVTYAALGFLFMYLLRERYLNQELAQSRKERQDIESPPEVDQAVKSSKATLPMGILAQGFNVSDISDPDKRDAATKQEPELYRPEVNAFIDQLKAAIDAGASVYWDDVAKVANIQYYRTYFEDDDDKRAAQARLAMDWIRRVLLFNFHNTDMTMKYADMLGATGDYLGAVTILEGMVRQPDAPVSVRQWLGYFLLFVPGRAAEAVRYSNQYRELVGEDTDSLFNIACAYAQAYCDGPDIEPDFDDANTNYSKALDFLRRALEREPDYATVVRTKWTVKGESFECFAEDETFKALVADRTPGGSRSAPPASHSAENSKATGGGSVDVSAKSDVTTLPMIVLRAKTGDPNTDPASGGSGDATTPDQEKT